MRIWIRSIYFYLRDKYAYAFLLKLNFKLLYPLYISPRLLRPSHILNPIRNRKVSFDYVINTLKKRRNIVIVETGCMRNDHGYLSFGDDGCSTLIFDLLARYTSGKNYSVDLSIRNINFSKKICKNTMFINADSVTLLSSFRHLDKVDLVYLDSYDFDPKSPYPSQLHHLNELKAVFGKLKSGALILIDDADAMVDGNYNGKASLIMDYFDKLGIKPIIKSYQVLYEVP
jgi:hypothetical protein